MLGCVVSKFAAFVYLFIIIFLINRHIAIMLLETTVTYGNDFENVKYLNQASMDKINFSVERVEFKSLLKEVMFEVLREWEIKPQTRIR